MEGVVGVAVSSVGTGVVGMAVSSVGTGVVGVAVSSSVVWIKRMASYIN